MQARTAPADGRNTTSRRVLAVASGGGHWVQLLRLLPAFEHHDVAFVTVNPAYRPQIGASRFYTVTDATRWDKLKLIRMTWELWRIMQRERPDVVISTGAAPGFVALRLARWFKARTCWIDSIANAECLSASGQRIGAHADLWLTQWPHLARPEGPEYRGAVV